MQNPKLKVVSNIIPHLKNSDRVVFNFWSSPLPPSNSIQAYDLRSEFGLNIYEICHAANVSDMSFINRGDVKYHPVPDCENWRVDVINEIFSILNHNLHLDFEEPFLKCIRDFLCSN